MNSDSIYTAAFVTSQGVPDRFGQNRRDLALHAVDAMRRHIRKTGIVRVPLGGTVMAV